MYWRLIISLEETIQVWIISSKDINLQYLCKVYCRDLGQYLMQFDALEKCVMRLQLTAFKYCNDWTPGQYRKTNEDRKFIIWINAHIPIEKQSNQGWNTSIHLKHNAPHMKVPLIFWFLIMISYLCFITNCGLNGYIYILEIVVDNLIHDSQNICQCLTHVMSCHQHFHLKEKINTVYSTFNDFVCLSSNFYLLES